MLDQRQQADRERVARRLAAGGDQQVEEHLQLEIGQRRAHAARIRDRAVHDGRQHVVAGRAALLGDQRGAVLEHRRCAACVRAVTLAEVAVVVVERRVRPREEPMAVGLRHAEQAGDRLQRQLGGHVDEEVAAAARDGGVEDRRRSLAQLVLQPGEHPRRHVAHRESAKTLMARVVHHVEQHAGGEAPRAGPRSACRRPHGRRHPPTRRSRRPSRPRRCRRSGSPPRTPRRPACGASADGTTPAPRGAAG